MSSNFVCVVWPGLIDPSPCSQLTQIFAVMIQLGRGGGGGKGDEGKVERSKDSVHNSESIRRHDFSRER